ncbi:MAG: serine hydrolase domain-containing protein [Chthoniobacteraceae bacterium]
MNLERFNNAFQENFSLRDEVGASASVWQHGLEVANLAAGFCDRVKTKQWTASTLVLFWSATKGLAASCVLHSLHRQGLSPDTKVCDFWPEFAQGGKGAITVGQVLSHRAGLAALDIGVSVLDYGAVIDALERQTPLWPVDEVHGYHPRTIGFLMDEIVRRLNDGVTLGNYWREEFAEPLDLEVWIGLPKEKLDRVAPVFAARAQLSPGDHAFYDAFSDPESLTFRAFASPQGLNGASAMNTPEVRTASYPGFGGIGTASSLAKFYAMLANGGELDGRRFFSDSVLGLMKTMLTSGFDRVLQVETAFSAGFMKDPQDASGKKLRTTFGTSTEAFGQPGAGGSVAFADPENGISFAYVMNQMGPGVLPNEKSLALIGALYE